MLENLGLLIVEREWSEDDWLYILGNDFLIGELAAMFYSHRFKRDCVWNENNWSKMNDFLQCFSECVVDYFEDDDDDSEEDLEYIPF